HRCRNNQSAGWIFHPVDRRDMIITNSVSQRFNARALVTLIFCGIGLSLTIISFAAMPSAPVTADPKAAPALASIAAGRWAMVDSPNTEVSQSTAASPLKFYFHGGPADDANRLAGTPSATFDANAPTASSDVTQTGSVNGNA